MYIAVSQVKSLEDFKLLITFTNGEQGIFDVSPYLSVGKFSELRDTALFNSVTVKFDTVEWANHLDMDPEFLYDKCTKIKGEQTAAVTA